MLYVTFSKESIFLFLFVNESKINKNINFLHFLTDIILISSIYRIIKNRIIVE